MSVNNVRPSFGSSYKIDMSQQYKTKEDCLKRDFAIGFLSGNAKNGEEAMKTLKQNENATITLNFADDYDSEAEKVLNAVGQKFDKIV